MADHAPASTAPVSEVSEAGGAHPPKARLVVRIGVTGHRPEHLQEVDLNVLHDRIRDVVMVVRETAEGILASERSSYFGTWPVLRVISPLAAGADRIVAEVAMAQGCELQAPLPFARREYEKDFPASVSEFDTLRKSATRVFELDGSRDRTNESYGNVGLMVLRHSDVLIAIWNGEPAKGEGGTAQILEQALRQGIPTIHIDSRKPHKSRLLIRDSSGNAELPVSDLRGLLTQVLASPRSEPLSLWRRVLQLFAPSGHTPRDLRETYFAEIERRHNLGFVFAMFMNCAARFWPGWPVWRVPSIPHKTLDRLGRVAPLRDFLKVHYDWADSLANYYTNLYRSSFLLNYVLAALAVMFALLNFLCLTHQELLTSIELALILLILVFTFWGNALHWHRRWVDYRLLAEYFRTSRFLAPLGRTVPSVRPATPYEHDDPANTWVSWHFRAIMREAGLPYACADQDYLQTSLKEVNDEIEYQIEYHSRNCEKLNDAHRHLHVAARFLFVLTLIACILHLIWHDDRLTFLAGLLPTLGAAIAGILGQAELDRNAERSEAMRDRLKEFPKALIWPQTSSALSAIGQWADGAADVMIRELLDWRNIFKIKVLGLPN